MISKFLSTATDGINLLCCQQNTTDLNIDIHHADLTDDTMARQGKFNRHSPANSLAGDQGRFTDAQEIADLIGDESTSQPLRSFGRKVELRTNLNGELNAASLRNLFQHGFHEASPLNFALCVNAIDLEAHVVVAIETLSLIESIP